MSGMVVRCPTSPYPFSTSHDPDILGPQAYRCMREDASVDTQRASFVLLRMEPANLYGVFKLSSLISMTRRCLGRPLSFYDDAAPSLHFDAAPKIDLDIVR